MLTIKDSASSAESTAAMYSNVVSNRVVSPCGRFESFDRNGYHFDIDWDEIDPPGADPDEEGMPHEQFMEELRVFCEELERQP